ncbi:ATP12 family chaperone protein [Aureimonas sp. AU4]|uniref:ATP12 family chaperone protein n=1 Tax=Aureimonas sp. AU4 TaxID=1638163 RepID=UPI000784DB4C|nr:ATP12 family protein [Aureimonas sp. AU4]
MPDMPARPELPKRFYTAVEIAEDAAGFSVRLDGRPVRTPARAPLALPTREAAEGVAEEWRSQRDVIDPGTMPITRLANTVIDGVVSNPDPIRQDLARYAETDLLAYRADGPDRLVRRQAEQWDPIVRWAEEEVAALFATGQGVMYVAQPPETVAALRARLDRETDPFRLGALHQATTLTGSLILALALASGRLDAAAAWSLAHVDEDWNIEQWGEDDEARARRDARFADMRAAALLLGRR